MGTEVTSRYSLFLVKYLKSFLISGFAPHQKGNIPLFLSCGHTICETCVTNIVRFAEPIECKVCHQSTDIKTKDVTKLVHDKKEFYKLFPVNMFMIGELTMEIFMVMFEMNKL